MAFTPSVSWTGGASNTGFNATPAGTDDPRQGDDRIRDLKLALAERISREMFFALKGGSSAGQEGNLRQGAGRIYHRSSAPTTKPDGNAIDSDDVGRLYCQSNTTPLTVYTSNLTWVGVRSSISSKANILIETGASALLRCKVININDWNMDSTHYVDIAHGLTAANIRSVSAVVIRDDSAMYIPSGFGNETFGSLSDLQVSYSGTNVRLMRIASGFFDNVDWDSTGFNRGFITIWYTA